MSVSDPTRIPLKLDPLRRRLSGTTVHGERPFDVPYVSPVTDDLWVGGCAVGLVLPREVVHVVSLYPWESYRYHEGVRSALAVRMYDTDGEVDGTRVDEIAEWVNACRRDGLTLVHCQAGLNRSALVACRALILGGATPESAISRLRSARSPAVLCNPAFERWLLRPTLSR